MAQRRRSRSLAALQMDVNLAPFVVEGKATGIELGVGSYGSVEEIIVKGNICAGKKIHDILIDAGNVGGGSIAQKYSQECQLMANLCHPNIAKFVGLCFIPDCRLPVLLMEKLDGSLDELLEIVPNIPLALKISMLEDVARGLLYLHTYDQPIIHRDLTATNVLLTTSLVAKITDLGNSRIVNLEPGQLARTLSTLPGTLVYMPPEALASTSRYGPSLDIFSYGHLALFTLTQVFPGDLLESTYPDPKNPEIVIARTEVERREAYFKQLEKELPGDEYHLLIQMVRNCLQNAPSRRPNVKEIVTEIYRIRGDTVDISGATVCIPRGDAVKQVIKMKELLTEKVERDTQLSEVQVQVNHLQAEKSGLEETQRHKEEDLQLKEKQIQDIQVDLQQKDMVIQQKETEIQRIQNELQHLQKLLQQKDAELLLVAGEGKQPQTIPLALQWKKVKDMPFPMGWYPVTVELKGKLYVGGGLTKSTDKKRTVMVYDLEKDEWSTLPLYDCSHFGMAVLNDRLVLVGGICVAQKTRCSELGVWNQSSQIWIHPFPPMPTARRSPSVVTHKDRWLIVVGGRCENLHTQLSTVEILDVQLGQWYQGAATPQPLSHATVAIVHDTCYILGGFTMTGMSSKKVFSVSLEELIMRASSVPANTQSLQSPLQTTSAPSTLSPWQILPDTHQIHSTALALNGALLAVGGEQLFASRAVYIYEPSCGKWIMAGELSSGRYMCACIAHSTGVIIIAGGMSGLLGGGSTQTVEIAEY